MDQQGGCGGSRRYGDHRQAAPPAHHGENAGVFACRTRADDRKTNLIYTLVQVSPRQYYTKVEYPGGADPSRLARSRPYHTAEGNRMQLATVRTYGVPRTPANTRPPRLMESLGTLRRYGADETVYCQDEAADYCYHLFSGAARK